jgi:hypothetical protein
VLFGIRAEYQSPLREILMAGQIIVLCFAAWKVGASAIRDSAQDRQRLAAGGLLLILPWLLFSLLSGFGRPDQATASENLLRYVVLFISAIAVGGGLTVLRESLSEAGERFYSSLGFAATMMASPIYLVWASIALAYSSARLHAGVGHVPPGILPLAIWSETLLFCGGFLTYLATAAFGASFARTRWLGRSAVTAVVLVSTIAALVLAMRGLSFPNPKTAFNHWYTIPGWVVGIPAVPWIIPCIMGVILLWRAGAKTGG